ncbi:hypothetical protein AGMMS49965_15240 [Bacteroidia bacterium]|nr:hypothetical protein AGMMS49965_15240 [Bacteroidia bacterium]
MKKMFLNTGLVALSAFALASCAPEEAESVKAIRNAQAKNLEAQTKLTEISNLGKEIDALDALGIGDPWIEITILEKKAELLGLQIPEKTISNAHLGATLMELYEITDMISSIKSDLYGTQSYPGGLTVAKATYANSIAAKEKEIADAGNADKVIKDLITNAKAEIAEWESFIALCTAEIAENEAIANDPSSTPEEIDDANLAISKAKDAITSAQVDIEAIEEDITYYEKELLTATRAETTKRAEKEALVKLASDIDTQIANKEKELETFKKRLDKLMEELN